MNSATSVMKAKLHFLTKVFFLLYADISKSTLSCINYGVLKKKSMHNNSFTANL